MLTLMETNINRLLFTAKFYIEDRKKSIMDTIDNALVSYDAWFLVLLAVLMTLALVVGTALAIWCLAYKGKKFTGNWNWSKNSVSINVECR